MLIFNNSNAQSPLRVGYEPSEKNLNPDFLAYNSILAILKIVL